MGSYGCHGLFTFFVVGVLPGLQPVARGKAMAELILQGDCQLLDLSPFDPARFTQAATVKGNRGRKQQGTNVGEQW